MYYGDELGMHDVDVPPNRRQDMKNTKSDTNRDPQRTPMQWSDEAYAGFSPVEPWLPIADDYQRYNVAYDKNNPDTMLSFYRRLIALRQQELALQVGDFVPVGLQGGLMQYKRVYCDSELLIIINFGQKPQHHPLPEKAKLIFSFSAEKEEKTVEDGVYIEGEGALVIRLGGSRE
jgi:alpha-glucosidase